MFLLLLPMIFRNNAIVTSDEHEPNQNQETSNSDDNASSSLLSTLPKCPVCELEIDYVDLTDHVDVCLRTYEVIPEENREATNIEEDGDIDVDDVDGLETYTWAGQTRVRSTSLIDGGLRGAGFLTITKGAEDQVFRRILYKQWLYQWWLLIFFDRKELLFF